MTAARGWRSGWTRLRDLVRDLLRQGLSPGRLAACVALGVTGSVCPVIGVPTPLLTVLALAFRINLPLIQAVNYACAPLQWVLIVPFLRAGEWVLGAGPLALGPQEILARLRADPGGFFTEFAGAALHAATGWLLLAPPLGLVLFAMLRVLLRRSRPGAPRSDPRPPANRQPGDS